MHAFLLFLFAFATARAQVANVPLSEQILETEARTALTAVGKARDVKLWGEVPVRFVTRSQVEATIRAEQVRFFGRYAGSEGHREIDVKQSARWLLPSTTLLRKPSS